METIRTDYFPHSSPLLPSWIPTSGLFVQLMRCVLDNHFQDAVQSIISPYLFPNFVYAARIDTSPTNPFNVYLKLGASEWNVAVPLSYDKTDIYDRAEPFAFYDGEWLLVFNLYNANGTGGVAATGVPHPLWSESPVPGTLVALSDHLVGGRALWRVGSGAWRNAVLEERGLFLPASYSSVQCYYERRPPYPSATLADGTLLEFRRTWSRGDDLLRLFADPRRARSLGSAIASIRGKLPGIHLFGIASECGLVSFLPNVDAYRQTTLPAGVAALYATHQAEKRFARYPNTIANFQGDEQPTTTNLILIHRTWLEGVVSRPSSVLTDDVS